MQEVFSPENGENLNNHKKNKKLFPLETGKTLITIRKQEVISPGNGENLNNHKKNEVIPPWKRGKT